MAAVPEGCDVLVVDHYGWSATQELACRSWARRILAIDDLCDRPRECDVLLDASLDRQSVDYAKWVSPDSRLLLGPGFAPLRREFAARRMNISRRSQAASPTRMFVNFGLVDQRNLTQQALNALAKIGFEGAVDLVLGSNSPHLHLIQSLVNRAGPNVRLHVEPQDIGSLMSSADFAVGAAGGSAWERCCLGVPSVIVTAAANQERNARTLAARGACELLTASESAKTFSQTLARLLHNRAGIERMSLAAAAITDGRGARRVALALRPEPTRQGGQVTLRRLTPDDAEQTYRWQQHPATRRYAHNPLPPSRQEHWAWITRKLSEPGCVLDVIEHDGTPAGVARLDRSMRAGSDLACEVSIYIAPELSGHGIGTAALAALRRMAPEAALLAHVLPENATSHALFSRAGYVLDDGIYVNMPSSRNGPG